MNVEELLADLDERIARGTIALLDARNGTTDDNRSTFLLGKIAGLAVVRDWLRGYK